MRMHVTPAYRSLMMAARADYMRRARNAMFYAASPEITASGRSNWIATARDMVREARARNRAALGF